MGSLALFDALVAIHSQLHESPESSRGAQCNIRARLIALAIGSVASKFRRELICAVFGLLSLLGKWAELPKGNAAHKGEMMGYEALGIIFGPLLVGNLLKNYMMKLENPAAGLVLYPVTPPMSRKEKLKKIRQDRSTGLTVDKVHVANNVAEMLISNWKQAVKHMTSLQVLKPDSERERSWATPSRTLRPSSSMDFEMRKLPSWEIQSTAIRLADSRASPIPPSPTRSYSRCSCITPTGSRPSGSRPSSARRACIKPSFSTLSPTAEEADGLECEGGQASNMDFQLSAKNRWSTVSLDSVQERSIHPALRGSPLLTLKLQKKSPKPSPSSQKTLKPSSRKEAKPGNQDAFGSCRSSKTFNRERDSHESPQVVLAPHTNEERTPDPHVDSARFEHLEPAPETLVPAETTGTVVRKITGLTRGPGSVKKLAAMFERVSREPTGKTDVIGTTASRGNPRSHHATGPRTPNNQPSQTPGEAPKRITQVFPSMCLAPHGNLTALISNVGEITECKTDPPITRDRRCMRPLSLPHECSPVVLPLTPLELPPGSPCSNAALHEHVRALQKELDARGEEISNLQSRIEAADRRDAGLLREKLRDAEHGMLFWKTRAERAERQLVSFQRFFSRLREVSGDSDGQGVEPGTGQVDGVEAGATKACAATMEDETSEPALNGRRESETSDDKFALGCIQGVLKELDTNLKIDNSQGTEQSSTTDSRQGSGEWGGVTNSDYSSDTVLISRGFSGSALGQWLRGDEELMPVEEVRIRGAE